MKVSFRFILKEISNQKANLQIAAKLLIVSILVIIFTFPENKWILYTGGDSSLAWVYNYLFPDFMEKGRQIIFPHGPLAFFMYPLAENADIFLIILTLFKILLVLNIYFVLSLKSDLSLIVSIFLSWFLSIILSINHLLLTIILLQYLNYWKHDKLFLKLTAFLLTGLAFYIKAYVAVLSGVLFVSFICIEAYQKRSAKMFIVNGVVMFITLYLFWIVIFGSFKGFFTYLYGMFQLAQDNSSAAAFYPKNNWIMLSLFIILILLLFFLNKSRNAKIYGILVILSLYAAWKHGMAREDMPHVQGLFNYVLIVLACYLVYSKSRLFYNTAVGLLILITLMVNIKNSIGYQKIEYNIFKSNNCIDFLTSYKELKKESKRKSSNNIKINKLPDFICDTIGKSTVDVYPWDYTYIAANDFNWQPRVILHSYAAYTSWLDKQEAIHFSSDKAPDFIIFHKKYNKYYNTKLNSIDYRYLLNDEPQTVLKILSGYKLIYNDDKNFVVRKREHMAKYTNEDLSSENTTWGKWIKVPDIDSGIIRAKLVIDKGLLQKVKSFFYKDEQFWIYLKLTRGFIHKYRIVPKNSKDGIWINPYVMDINDISEVDSIMFKCSNQKIIPNEVIVNWERIMFDENNSENIFWENKNKNENKHYIYSESFEKPDSIYWSNNIKANTKPLLGIHNSKCLVASSGTYSSSFRIQIDSLNMNNISLTANLWVKSPEYKYENNIFLVVEVPGEEYNMSSIDEQLLDKNSWNLISNSIVYHKNKGGGIFKCFIFNLSDTPVYIDDLSFFAQPYE